MLVGLFRSNQPAVLAALPVLVPVLFGAILFRPVVLPELMMPLYSLLAELVNGNSWIQGSVNLLLMILIAAQLTLLVNDSDLSEKRSHLPALLFPLLYAAFGPSMPLDPALVGMPFVIAALHRAWAITNIGSAMSALFDAGFLLGIAAIIYLPYVFLVVVIWASISVIRPFHLREYAVPLLGSAVVLYLTWGIITLIDAEGWDPLLTIMYAHSQDPAMPTVPDSQRILLFMVLGGILPVGIFSYAKFYRRGIMRQKNLRSSFLAFIAAIAILIVFVWLLTGVVPTVMVAVPLSVICSHALQGAKRMWLQESAVFALLILALWAQWGW